MNCKHCPALQAYKATHVLGSNCTFDYFALSHSFLGHHGDHVVESSIVADENFQSLSLENVDSEDLTTFFNRHRGLRAFQKPVDFTFAISKQPMMLRWMQDLASRWFLKNTPASGTCRQHPRWFYLAWGWRPRLFIFFWSVRPWKNRTHPGRQMMAHGCTWIWQPMFDEFGWSRMTIQVTISFSCRTKVQGSGTSFFDVSIDDTFARSKIKKVGSKGCAGDFPIESFTYHDLNKSVVASWILHPGLMVFGGTTW